MNILAIETSCDETAAAVVRDGREVLSSQVSSQIALHAPHGGVVPELAARAHLEMLAPVVDAALAEVEGGWDAIDAVAVTRGPGLAGCLVVGAAYAQAAARGRGLPITGVSHLAGHVYSAWLADAELEPPFVALVVSGGHTDTIELSRHGEARRLASTRDDAVGEAFDKVARMLGLPYPGGPVVERAARSGDPRRFPLPRTRLEGAFSFSGLKTAVRYAIRDLPAAELDERRRPAPGRAARRAGRRLPGGRGHPARRRPRGGGGGDRGDLRRRGGRGCRQPGAGRPGGAPLRRSAGVGAADRGSAPTTRP